MVDRTPLHTGIINGKAVRFFEAPPDEARFPWHVHSDLLSALGFEEDAQGELLAIVARDHPELAARITTTDGPLLICDNMVAKACFSGPPSFFGLSSKVSFGAYRSALSAATGCITRFMIDDVGRATWLHNAFLHDLGEAEMTVQEEQEYRASIKGETNPWLPGGSRYGMPTNA